MIKLITHVAKAIIAVATALLFFTSCNGIGIEGDGNVTSQNRTAAGEFKSVEVSGGLEVIIEQGDVRKVTVEADKNLQEHIKVEVKGSDLKIHTDSNIRNAKAKRVYVTLPVVEEIEANGGSSVKTKNTIKSDKLELSTSSGASLEVAINAAHAGCDASSGSHLEVSGKVSHAKVGASSGSSIDAKDLIAQKVDADVSSGASITVNPTESLNAEASSGGHIKYVSTPGSLNKKASSGGSVSQN
jgi:hypothetical protein